MDLRKKVLPQDIIEGTALSLWVGQDCCNVEVSGYLKDMLSDAVSSRVKRRMHQWPWAFKEDSQSFTFSKDFFRLVSIFRTLDENVCI
jgi:hypothetical protein